MGLRAARWIAGAGMLALACGPSVSSSEQEGAGGGSAGDSSSGAALTSSTGSPGLSSSSTGEPPLEGPGCGDPPPCDRGTFEGHALIESETDLAQFEGYTEVTGFLQIAGSEDLVCLDRLACLEVVGRDVRIQQNAVLESTAGLRNVREIGEAERWGRAAVYVGENTALKTLRGLTRDVGLAHLVLWRNPVLSDVAGLDVGRLSSLTALENPRLESLTSLHGFERVACFINRNARLCSAEIEAVCSRDSDESYGDLSHIYYGADCPEGPAPLVDHGYRHECSVQVEDCPGGQKCMPITSTDLVCKPVASAPRDVGEACETFGDGHGDAVDNCVPRAVCRYGECIPMAFGNENALACPSLDQDPTTDADGVELYCIPLCDPLAGACGGGRICAPSYHGSFACVDPRDDSPVRAGEACGWFNSCADGLACVVSDSMAACGLDESCCGELCDMNAPTCADGRECVSWWDEYGLDDPLPKVEHVGLCVDP